MTNIWHDISPSRINPEDFIAVIEIEKGSKKKYELDKETGHIIWTASLYLYRYPANYGLIAHLCGRRRPAGRAGTVQRGAYAAEPVAVLSHRRHHHAGPGKMVKVVRSPLRPAYTYRKPYRSCPAISSSEMRHISSVCIRIWRQDHGGGRGTGSG